MVGRSEQIAFLRELAGGAEARSPSVVVVLGEAGIGKTRLCDELVGSAGRMVVARGNCTPGTARGLPLAPVSEVLQDLYRQLGPGFGRVTGGNPRGVEALVPELASGEGSDERAIPSQAQLFDAVVGLLRDVGRSRCLVIVVEDVHWADTTSRDLLELLARSLRDEKVLLVLTARTDDPCFESCRTFLAEIGGLRHGVRIELARLTRSEVADQVAALRGDQGADDAELERIVGLTEGVPLLVEEVVDTGPDDDLGALADLLLGHRLSRLSAASRAVVETAAVAELEASADELSLAAPLPPGGFDTAFGEALSAGVLVRGRGRVRFRHALLREATLARLLPEAERELHRRWSRVLGEQPQGRAALLAAAYHRRRSGDLGGALESYLRAADLARRLPAYAEQVQLLEQAAELWHQVPDAEERTGTNLTDVYCEATWATHVSMVGVEDSMRLVDAAVASLPADANPHVRAMLTLLWHRTRWTSGAGYLTVEEVLAACADVEMDPPTEAALLACLEGTSALMRTAELTRAEEFARRGVAVAEAIGRPEFTARALGSLALVQVRLGDDQGALRTAGRARVLAQRCGDLFVHAEALTVADFVRWSADEDRFETCRRLIELLGGDRPGPLRGWWGLAQTNYAEALTETGRWDEAQAALALVLAEDMPDRVSCGAHRLLNQLAVWRGEVQTPRPDLLPASPPDAQEDVDLDDMVAAHYSYAEVASQLGDLSGARALVMSALDDDRIVGTPASLFRLLWVAARIEADAAVSARDAVSVDGAGNRAAARIQHLLSVAPPRNPRNRAYAAHARADLARCSGSDEPEAWSRVVTSWRQVGHPFPLATALVRAGTAYAAAGRRDEAAATLREATEIGERLGAGPLVEEALTAARQAHLRVPTRSPASDAGLGLTRRELDVLRLVAEGASNSAIATALVISPKTASVHVSNILAKLGVSNRGEAAALAHRTGIVVYGKPK